MGVWIEERRFKKTARVGDQGVRVPTQRRHLQNHVPKRVDRLAQMQRPRPGHGDRQGKEKEEGEQGLVPIANCLNWAKPKNLRIADLRFRSPLCVAYALVFSDHSTNPQFAIYAPSAWKSPRSPGSPSPSNPTAIK